MINRTLASCLVVLTLTTAALLVGCDREVSSEKTSTVSKDGTLKTDEKTVTQSPDGSVTKSTESKKTTPPEKP